MNPRNGFRIGQCYTRKQIAASLGGGIQNYLPHKDQHVVCGCFRTDLNPNAPAEVLPANTDDKKRWAETFSKQKEAIPVFLKRVSNRWEYQGLWRCVSLITDGSVVRERGEEARRSDVAMVLKLQRVES